MRISDLRLHPVAIADGPLRSSYGRHAPYALRTIVEVRSTDGLTGISETYGGDGPLAALESVRDRVVGADPFQLTRLWVDLNRQAEQQAKEIAGGRSQTWLVPGENPVQRDMRDAGLPCERAHRARRGADCPTDHLIEVLHRAYQFGRLIVISQVR